MDNLSHSLVGLAAGELVHRTLAPEVEATQNSARRRLLLTASWLASNVPDLDIFLSPLYPAPLGYLLHHRGHSHTLLLVLPQALLLAGLIWLLWPAARRLLGQSASARTGLAIALLLGLTLHILMDYLNSYGVHPFYPFEPGWFYGDLVFIVEPVFWVAFGVPVFMLVRPLWGKALLLAAMLGALVFFTRGDYLGGWSLALLIVFAAAQAAIQLRASARGTTAFATALTLVLGFVAVQAWASGQARRVIEARLAASDGASRVADVALTAYPANPLCWNFVSVEHNEAAGSYRLRRGQLSLGGVCPSRFSDGGAHEAAHDVAQGVRFWSQHDGRLAELRVLGRENCNFQAWLRFARAPWLEAGRAFDLRFAASPRGNFTAIRMDDFNGRACPADVPQWGFPRADLLAPFVR